MVFIKHNSLKSDIFFNPIFIQGFSGSRLFRVRVFQSPGFSGSRFFRVQVFQSPGFSGSRFFRVRVQGSGFSGSGSRVQLQVLEVAEYNMRNILLKNHTQNVVEKLFPDPFLKNQNWVYLRINSLKFYEVCFYFILIWGLSKYSESKLHITCFILYKAFLKSKKSSGTSLPAWFSAWFLKKNIHLVIFY